MDNAMVKRGIGAVILAIIAALLLGLLLKDNGDQRQDLKDLPLPGNPIPSLSTSDTEETQITSLIEEKSRAEESEQSPEDSALDQMRAVTTEVEAAENAIIDTDAAKQATNDPSSDNKPGFSFRPSEQDEEQKINTDQEIAANPETVETNETVVADNASNTNKTAKVTEEAFKPVIENEPEKKPSKTVIKNVVKQPVVKKQPVQVASTPKKTTQKPPKTNTSATINNKYRIQLLATSSRSRANKLAKTMTSEGYVSFITKKTTNNKVLYRVRVGGYESRSKAIKAQEGMKRRYQKNFSVQNSLVVAE